LIESENAGAVTPPIKNSGGYHQAFAADNTIPAKIDRRWLLIPGRDALDSGGNYCAAGLLYISLAYLAGLSGI
jgi:hypothetical protein